MLVRRNTKTGGNDLHTVFRPTKIDALLGNETNKKIIKNYLDSDVLPHCLLLTGDYGCGKTTVGRIIATAINCETNGVSSTPCLVCSSCNSIINQNNLDMLEINLGQSGTKDNVDMLVRDLPTAPFSNRFKVLLMDEAHALTTASQNLLLKIMEDSYTHVYFIFCTNQPQKLLSTFISRCSVFNFSRLSQDLIVDLLLNVAEYDGMSYSKEILDYVAEECEGIPRTALIWLGQINSEGTWTIDAAKEITGILLNEDDPQIIELSRALLKGQWKKTLELYKKLEKLPAETVRIAVAGFFTGCLKRAKTFPDGRKYSQILDIITVPIYESGKLGQHKFYNYLFKTVDLINSSKK